MANIKGIGRMALRAIGSDHMSLVYVVTLCPTLAANAKAVKCSEKWKSQGEITWFDPGRVLFSDDVLVPRFSNTASSRWLRRTMVQKVEAVSQVLPDSFLTAVHRVALGLISECEEPLDDDERDCVSIELNFFSYVEPDEDGGTQLEPGKFALSISTWEEVRDAAGFTRMLAEKLNRFVAEAEARRK